MQSGRVAPVDNSRNEEEGGGKKGRGEKEGKNEEERKRSPLTMGSRDFGPLTS